MDYDSTSINEQIFCDLHRPQGKENHGMPSKNSLDINLISEYISLNMQSDFAVYTRNN